MTCWMAPPAELSWQALALAASAVCAPPNIGTAPADASRVPSNAGARSARPAGRRSHRALRFMDPQTSTSNHELRRRSPLRATEPAIHPRQSTHACRDACRLLASIHDARCAAARGPYTQATATAPCARSKWRAYLHAAFTLAPAGAPAAWCNGADRGGSRVGEGYLTPG